MHQKAALLQNLPLARPRNPANTVFEAQGARLHAAYNLDDGTNRCSSEMQQIKQILKYKNTLKRVRGVSGSPDQPPTSKLPKAARVPTKVILDYQNRIQMARQINEKCDELQQQLLSHIVST